MSGRDWHEGRLMALNVVCCETAMRLESGAKRKYLALAQNVTDDRCCRKRQNELTENFPCEPVETSIPECSGS
jgi:hypothetical protein